MNVLLVVDDESDIRLLVRFQFGGDPDFEVDGEATDIETALDAATLHQPDLIVLDHRLDGDVTGLDAAPQLKMIAPACVIILFSASEELRRPATDSPAIDAFLLKTDIDRLVPLARRLVGLPTV